MFLIYLFVIRIKAESQHGEKSSNASSGSSGSRDDGLSSPLKEDKAKSPTLMAGGTLEIVTQDHSEPLFKWFESILKAKIETDNKQQQGLKIPKIPHVLLKCTTSNLQHFFPSVVSIGPHHRNRAELPDKLKLIKLTMVRQFVKESGKSIEEVYRKVKELYSDAKKQKEYYASESIADLEDEEFTQMMFVDGCFILQFINCVMRKHDVLNMSNQEVALVRRDLLLLENQLPYEVLRTLMKLHGKAEGPKVEATSEKEWDKLINDYIKVPEPWKPLQRNFILRLIKISLIYVYIPTVVLCVPIMVICGPIAVLIWYCCMYIQRFRFPSPKVKTRKKVEHHAHLAERLYENTKLDDVVEHPAHLIERLYDQFIEKNTKLDDVPKSHGPYLYYSAKDLKKVGIYFEPSKTSAFTDVVFKQKLLSGILKLPPIIIDEYTKAMLLNLVAYETCAYESNKHWVTAYICFMDSLINDAEDVMELRSNGIICNFLGTDEKVADLFNGIGSDLVPNPLAYGEVKRNINLQCQSTIKKWVAEFQKAYFSSPWTFIAVVAATFAIILTAIQTYFAAFPAQKG